MDVRELMSSPIHSVGPEDTLNCAARMMRDHALGCLAVVNDRGELAGILTDRDIALTAYESGEALWRLRVVDSMRTPVFTVRPTDDVTIAARLMRQHRVRRLPVVEGHRPIGMISLDDLAHASQQPVIEPAAGLSRETISDIYDATSGRTKKSEGDPPPHRH